MATWNDLFLKEKYRDPLPQPEVHRFVRKLEQKFADRPLSFWDLCCGAGRHTVLMAGMGHCACASDAADNGISHTKQMLEMHSLYADVRLCDMACFPFKDKKFHGVISWDALHHNTIDNIQKAVDNVYDSLVQNGEFLLTLLSNRGGAFGKGTEIEKNTYIRDNWEEEGVLHHYFDEQEIRHLFRRFNIVILAEQVTDYVETEPKFYESNPFFYTKWNVLLEKV